MTVKKKIHDAGLRIGDMVAIVNAAGKRYVGILKKADNVFGYLEMPGNRNFHFADDAIIEKAKDGENPTHFTGSAFEPPKSLVTPAGKKSDKNKTENVVEIDCDEPKGRISAEVEEIAEFVNKNPLITFDEIVTKLRIDRKRLSHLLSVARNEGLTSYYGRSQKSLEEKIATEPEYVKIAGLLKSGLNKYQTAKHTSLSYFVVYKVAEFLGL